MHHKPPRADMTEGQLTQANQSGVSGISHSEVSTRDCVEKVLAKGMKTPFYTIFWLCHQ